MKLFIKHFINKISFIAVLLCSFSANSLYAKDIKIAFLTTSLCYLGTDIALFDYAHFNEELLGNISYIFSPRNDHPVTERYRNRFGERCFLGYNMEALEEIIMREHIEIVYIIKAGEIDQYIFKNAKNAIHAVFFPTEPHGEACAVISDWLNERYHTNLPVVPHMIYLDNTTDTLRKELNIPEDAIVFGRHGNELSFDYPFVHKAIIDTVLSQENIYFLFLNTKPFFSHNRIIYLPPTTDLNYKTKFINTCDAMIHGREHGETFGLACGEFSIKNKPVITRKFGDLAHVRILGDAGIYYDNYDEIYEIFRNFRIESGKNYNKYQDYSPEKIMKIFEDIFITPLVSGS